MPRGDVPLRPVAADRHAGPKSAGGRAAAERGGSRRGPPAAVAFYRPTAEPGDRRIVQTVPLAQPQRPAHRLDRRKRVVTTAAVRLVDLHRRIRFPPDGRRQPAEAERLGRVSADVPGNVRGTCANETGVPQDDEVSATCRRTVWSTKKTLPQTVLASSTSWVAAACPKAASKPSGSSGVCRTGTCSRAGQPWFDVRDRPPRDAGRCNRPSAGTTVERTGTCPRAGQHPTDIRERLRPAPGPRGSPHEVSSGSGPRRFRGAGPQHRGRHRSQRNTRHTGNVREMNLSAATPPITARRWLYRNGGRRERLRPAGHVTLQEVPSSLRNVPASPRAHNASVVSVLQPRCMTSWSQPSDLGDH